MPMKSEIYGRAVYRFFVLILFIEFIFSIDAFSQKVRILPLGDSITRDIFKANPRPDSLLTGYRQPLWTDLNSEGFPIDFVGSDSSGYGAVPKFDPNNAGFGGYSTKQILNLIKTGYDAKGNQITPGPYLNYYPADIILLHIGTNQLDSSTADLEDLLNYIDAFQDTTHTLIWVILAKIINRYPYSQTTTIYNDNIGRMAEERIKDGDKIKVVDMEKDAGLVYNIDTVAPYINGDLYDHLHPNKSGYEKMATLFFDTLDVLLNNIIPVQLTNFAFINNEDKVILNWETSLEINNYGFEVERTSGKGIWEELGFIDGVGNSYKIHEYMYTDSSVTPNSNLYEYRLKQIGSDGESKYIANLYVKVKFTTSINNFATNVPAKFELEQNFPNPFNPTTTIKYDIAKKSSVKLEIYNLLGEKVTTLLNATLNPGRYDKTWDAGPYASGVYLYILNIVDLDNQQSYSFSKKMILIK